MVEERSASIGGSEAMAFMGIGKSQFGVGMYSTDCAIGPVADPSKAAKAFGRHARAAVVKG